MPATRTAAPVPGPTAPAMVQTPLFARDPVGVLLRARARHGPVFALRFANVGPVVVAATPDVLDKVVLADPDRSHAGEARRGVLPQASDRSTFGADGERHRTARARVEPPFRLPAVESHAREIDAVIDRHLDAWPEGRPFRLLSRLRTLTEELFVRVVLGVRDDPRAQRMVAAVGAALRTPGNPPLTPPDRDQAPPVGPLLHLEVERRLRPIRGLLADELRERDTGGDVGPGILGHVVESGLDADQALDELLVVLAAAQEPPSIALSRVLDRFARDPALQHRLDRDGAEGAWFDAVVDETLRLHPPALALMRRLTAPADVGGHALPAGTDVMAALPLLHRDPAVFPDPHRFDPERFRSGDRPATFLPFGAGTRRCPGEPLAGVELATVVPAVLRRWHLRPVARRPERAVQRATVLVPQHGQLVVGRRRRA